jgi:hypothetical protein
MVDECSTPQAAVTRSLGRRVWPEENGPMGNCPIAFDSTHGSKLVMTGDYSFWTVKTAGSMPGVVQDRWEAEIGAGAI